MGTIPIATVKSSTKINTVSIQLMSPASGDPRMISQTQMTSIITGFHSINVPSEWGLNKHLTQVRLNINQVSIQLMSPASGDNRTQKEGQKKREFPFN